MRTYDIPYIPNPARTNDPIPGLESLDLRTITRTYLCGKSHGKVSECMRCPAQCAYGKRALELLANPVDAITPKQGVTLLEKAREDALKQKQEVKNVAKDEKEVPIVDSSGRKRLEGWYEKAYNSGDPLKWIMETFNENARKAKQRVYAYQHVHPGVKDKMPMWESQKKKPVEDVQPEAKQFPVNVNTEAYEPTAQASPENKTENKDNPMLAPLESKINELMNMQDEYKKKMEYYEKLYRETKTKVDALYEALNILSE